MTGILAGIGWVLLQIQSRVVISFLAETKLAIQVDKCNDFFYQEHWGLKNNTKEKNLNSTFALF